MSKKPIKTMPRATSRAASRKSSQAAVKRPPAAPKHDSAERIARALETIAAHLGTSPANARKLVQTARTELRAQLSPHEVMLLTGSRRNSGRVQGRARSTTTQQ